MDNDDESKVTRRDFLSWAAAVAVALSLPGCEPAAQQVSRTRRDDRPSAVKTFAPPADKAFASPVVNEPQQILYVQVPQQPAPSPVRTAFAGEKVSALSRNAWGATPAVPAKMKAMNGVTRITIHHEGSAKPNNDSTANQVSATLRLIQSQHRKRLGAGDIGYHFIIDRTGTIWQGRDWAYQGAHASGANSHNIGIMLLGNFEIQQPTRQQIDSLHRLTASLVRKFGLNPRKDIYGHSDFCNTQCPGKHLKPQIAALRKGI